MDSRVVILTVALGPRMLNFGTVSFRPLPRPARIRRPRRRCAALTLACISSVWASYRAIGDRDAKPVHVVLVHLRRHGRSIEYRRTIDESLPNASCSRWGRNRCRRLWRHCCLGPDLEYLELNDEPSVREKGRRSADTVGIERTITAPETPFKLKDRSQPSPKQGPKGQDIRR